MSTIECSLCTDKEKVERLILRHFAEGEQPIQLDMGNLCINCRNISVETFAKNGLAGIAKLIEKSGYVIKDKKKGANR